LSLTQVPAEINASSTVIVSEPPPVLSASISSAVSIVSTNTEASAVVEANPGNVSQKVTQLPSNSSSFVIEQLSSGKTSSASSSEFLQPQTAEFSHDSSKLPLEKSCQPDFTDNEGVVNTSGFESSQSLSFMMASQTNSIQKMLLESQKKFLDTVVTFQTKGNNE